MQEVKPNKKPLLFYWLIALLILFTLNTFVFPSALKSQVQDVDYGTFMDMMNEKEIGSVMVNTDEIVFTDKSGDNVYSTGNLNDPQLVDRLYESGAEFDKEVVKEMNPILYYFISLIIPIALMIFVSRWLSKKMLNKMGTAVFISSLTASPCIYPNSESYRADIRNILQNNSQSVIKCYCFYQNISSPPLL